MLVRFKNTELCRLTEQVIFTDPYYNAPVNRHTTPQLDSWAANIQKDAEAKAAAVRLKVGRWGSTAPDCSTLYFSPSHDLSSVPTPSLSKTFSTYFSTSRCEDPPNLFDFEIPQDLFYSPPCCCKHAFLQPNSGCTQIEGRLP